MNHTVIKTENLVKKYRRYRKREGIGGSIAGLWKRDYEEKTAVNHIDLSVEEGEFIGLIGPNGATKELFQGDIEQIYREGSEENA